jgi:ABC-type amino acid transport substrate-binding protein
MGKTFLIGLFCFVAASAGANARTLDDVRSSGVVTCGLDQARPGISMRDAAQNWSGVYVDLCRALAVAIFGDATRADFVALAPEEHVVALQSGEIDVLMDDEPIQSGKDIADGLMWLVPILHEANPALTSYAPRVRQGDDQWFQVVREVQYELIRAAEHGLTQKQAATPLQGNATPDPSAFGFSGNWRVRIVAAVGNHAEILARNLGPDGAAGVNAIWSQGGLHWAPP